MWRLVARKSALVLLAIAAGCAGVPAAELVFDIRIEHGHVPDTMHLMRVHQGDGVKLRWTSDRPLVLHLHGYDLEQRVAELERRPPAAEGTAKSVSGDAA